MPMTTMFGPAAAISAARRTFSSKTLFVEDHVVGRKHSDDCVGIDALQQKCCQPNRGRRVASHRLGQYLVRRQRGKLLQNRLAQVFIADDPEVLCRSERQEALNRLLDHGLLAVERQQLLGASLAAERPEPCAASTGENDGIESWESTIRSRRIPYALGEDLVQRVPRGLKSAQEII